MADTATRPPYSECVNGLQSAEEWYSPWWPAPCPSARRACEPSRLTAKSVFLCDCSVWSMICFDTTQKVQCLGQVYLPETEGLWLSLRGRWAALPPLLALHCLH